ncbi:hypothetical protein BDK51DRAFT_25963 [Blyttiomyces helicus]|uniref:Uncharacterized protein n=1 Tax=Blyttiomyces helicus TaxID=388810 RepID=A0A4P9W5I6_9FUNG|nr:hypothetical protein BDK51DRAFT_25963 [Blyttiomyces helicus]|eukprot:RKO87669.1 hypothetical protein BDK51DRAFT_25963 [Blyttiomyces helicus]
MVGGGLHSSGYADVQESLNPGTLSQGQSHVFSVHLDNVHVHSLGGGAEVEASTKNTKSGGWSDESSSDSRTGSQSHVVNSVSSAAAAANCFFCKPPPTFGAKALRLTTSQIIKGQIPSFKHAETELLYAFLDINPIAKSHEVSTAIGTPNYNLLQSPTFTSTSSCPSNCPPPSDPMWVYPGDKKKGKDAGASAAPAVAKMATMDCRTGQAQSHLLKGILLAGLLLLSHPLA